MGKVLGIISFKKGSGKTTTAAYLSASLRVLNRKVVSVDLGGGLSKKLGVSEGVVEVEGISWWHQEHLGAEADYVIVDLPYHSISDEIFSQLDSVIIPVEARRGGLQHFNSTLLTLQEHEDLLIEGILLSQADAHNDFAAQMGKDLEEYFPDFIFKTVISRNFYLSKEAFNVLDVRKQGWHSGFVEFLALANELIEHEH